MPKPTAAVLDTNYLIRLIVRDVPTQTDQVVQLLQRAKDNSLVVSNVVFAEAVFVLEKYYEFERSVIVQALSFILEYSAFKVSTALLAEGLSLYETHKQLSFVDCYAWVQANRAGHELLSFDQALMKRFTKK